MCAPPCRQFFSLNLQGMQNVIFNLVNWALLCILLIPTNECTWLLFIIFGHIKISPQLQKICMWRNCWNLICAQKCYHQTSDSLIWRSYWFEAVKDIVTIYSWKFKWRNNSHVILECFSWIITVHLLSCMADTVIRQCYFQSLLQHKFCIVFQYSPSYYRFCIAFCSVFIWFWTLSLFPFDIPREMSVLACIILSS